MPIHSGRWQNSYCTMPISSYDTPVQQAEVFSIRVILNQIGKNVVSIPKKKYHVRHIHHVEHQVSIGLFDIKTQIDVLIILDMPRIHMAYASLR